MCTQDQARKAIEGIGLVAGLAADEIHRRLQRFGRLGDVGQRGLAFYLYEFDRAGYHRDAGLASIQDYAEAHFDITPRRCRELIAAERKLRDLPRLDEAFCAHRLSWTKVLSLLRVVTPEHEAAWVAKAEDATCKELRREVRLARPGGPPPDPRHAKGTPEVRYVESMTLGVVAHQKQELAKQKLSDERGRAITNTELQELLLDLYLTHERDGEIPGWKHVPSSLYRILLQPAFPQEGEGTPLFTQTEDGLLPIDGGDEDDVIARNRSACACCDGEVVGHDGKDVDLPTPPQLRKRVLDRDNHRCRCCGGRGELHAHHIVFRSRGGRTKIWNLITLCVRCHALVHEGLLRIDGERQRNARFVDADGRPVHAPGRGIEPSDVLRLESPDRPVSITATASEPPTTLDRVPDVADTDWWRRHADLLRPRRDGGLELTPGRPARPPAPEEQDAPEAPVPFEEAFAGIVGQDALLARLCIEAGGARAMGAPFPHTLLVGPPGTGKTTLAHGIARTVGGRLIGGSGPMVQDTHALVGLLASLGDGDVLFLDEIHAVPRSVLEVLYQAMAEGHVTLTLRAGSRARVVRLRLARFTLLGATTEGGELTPALRSRFALLEHLGWYDEDSLGQIARSKAEALGFDLEPEAAEILAAHARGTPRELLRLVQRVLRDSASRGVARVDAAAASRTLRRLGYDERGLAPLEQRYLGLLRRARRPLALRRIATMLGLDLGTLLRDVEPWLCRLGLLEITPQGRKAWNTAQSSGIPASLRRLA